MGWSFQLSFILMILCFAILIAGLVALGLGSVAFFIAKRRSASQKHHSKRTPRATALAVGILAFILVCLLEYVFTMGGTYRTKTPEDQDVVGTWVPTEWAIEWMNENEYELSDHRIEFFPDGSFTTTSIPTAWLAGVIEQRDATFSGGGSWEIIHSESDWQVALSFTSSASVTVPSSYNAPWIPTMELIYFPVPGETNQASFQRCGPEKIRMSDPPMDPYRAAIIAVDRVSLGFSPITYDAWFEIQGGGGGSLVWIDVYADTSRTIALREMIDAYQWVFEQENVYGPDKWVDHDAATWQEHFTIQYQTEDLNGGQLNQTTVIYTGRDPRITNLGPLWMDIEEIKPFLVEFEEWREGQPPNPIDLCP